MDVVDAQIHVWEDDRPGRPWDAGWAEKLSWMLDCRAPTIDRTVAAMDAVGIAGAVVTSFPLYPDVDYALEAAARHPDRFRAVTHIDLAAPHPEEGVERYARRGAAAIRVAFAVAPDGFEHLERGDYQPVFRAAARFDLPVMLAISGRPAAAETPVRANPDVQFVVDHLGLAQPHGDAPLPPAPLAGLDDLLALAVYPNLAAKLSGLPTLSAEPYPYRDLWPHLHRVIEAFGPDRLLWGSDFTRTWPHHTYAEALGLIAHSDELTGEVKRRLLSQTARRLLRWE